MPQITTAASSAGFLTRLLTDGSIISTGQIPNELAWSDGEFESAWELHPIERHWVKMWGAPIQVPRWQQAFGSNYEYTGARNNALSVPLALVPLLQFIQRTIDPRLNGLLLNWYDGPEDYIGPHHDSTKGLVQGTPIVTVSFGEQREFRLERGRGANKQTDMIVATHGGIIVLPWDTNKAWKHSVPKRTKYSGRRISVTLRAFNRGVLPADQFFAPAGRDAPQRDARPQDGVSQGNEESL